MLQALTKSAASERRRIEELLRKQEGAVRRAFRQFLDDAKSLTVLRQIRRLLEEEGIEAALRVADAYVARLGDVIPRIFMDVGGAEAAALASQMSVGNARVAISFDPSWPRAAEIMRRNRLEFVREFTRGQREASRAAIVESFQEGKGAVATARSFRDSIGLTEYQRRAVANYRRLLENNNAEALSRDLRDRRFDRSVRRAVESGEPLSPKQINRMVERYRERYLQYRAEVISRTESIRTANQARNESLSQALEQSGMPDNRVKRMWRATHDHRVRDTHRLMNGQVRGLRELFESPSGARLMYPGDPNAPRSEIIQCRCTITISFTDPGEVNVSGTSSEVKPFPRVEPPSRSSNRRPRPAQRRSSTRTSNRSKLNSQQKKFINSSKPTRVTPKKTVDPVNIPSVKSRSVSRPDPIKLNSEEIGAIEYYKGDGFYEMNRKLLNPSSFSEEQVKEAIKQRERIDKIIDKSKTTKDNVLYRGIRSKELFGKAEDLVGKTLKNVTTQSTSYDVGVARNYAGLLGDFSADPGASVLLKIRVPKGSRALNLRELTDINMAEKEILLKGDSSYKVLSVTQKAGHKVLEVEYAS